MAAGKELEIAEGSGKKKKLLIIIAAVIVVAGGAAAYFLLGGSDNTVAATDTSVEQQGETAVATTGNALYVPLPRPFIFNVPGAGRDRMVQIKVQLLVRGANNETIAKRHIPLIESSLLQTFSSANADEIVTVAGRDALKNKALSDLQQTMIDVAKTVVVEEVLFTQFVIQ